MPTLDEHIKFECLVCSGGEGSETFEQAASQTECGSWMHRRKDNPDAWMYCSAGNIRDAIEQARSEERERCCRAVCEWCDRAGEVDPNGIAIEPSVRYKNSWAHKNTRDGRVVYLFHCDAASIRALGEENTDA